MSLFVPKKRKVLVSLIFTLLIMSCFRDFRFFTGDLRLILGTKVFFSVCFKWKCIKGIQSVVQKENKKVRWGKRKKNVTSLFLFE